MSRNRFEHKADILPILMGDSDYIPERRCGWKGQDSPARRFCLMIEAEVTRINRLNDIEEALNGHPHESTLRRVIFGIHKAW